MNYNKGLLLTCLASAASPGAAQTPAASLGGTKPNILVILADDLGLGDLSCQWAGDIRTPNIDRIFESGVRFDNFYANSTVSSPSRAGLLTGCYPQRVGVPGVIRTNPAASWGYLDPQAVLLPQMLSRAGYSTALVGKWHLGLESPNLPLERGFDHFHGFLGDMMDDYYTHMRQGNNYMRDGEQVIRPEGHATDLFTQWAVDYISSREDAADPFFLYLAYNAPHLPLHPPAEWEARVRQRESGISERRGKLVALIEHMDHNIGKLIDALRETGELENTIVIFTSDNGGDRPAEANNGPVRGYKTDMYEGGIKVACAASWPGKLNPGRIDSQVIMSDIFPTLCDLAGVAPEHRIDGVSFLPLLEGDEQPFGERPLFWVRREHGDLGGKTQNAVRMGDYKLLQNRPFEAMQLFDLARDPLEENPLPLSGQTFETLYKAMMEHYRTTGSVPWQKPE